MRIVFILGFILHATFFALGQYGDLGLAEQPSDEHIVDDLIFYGEVNDMSGGYAVGDIVSNFTVYDYEGNSLNLYEELAGDKPVILMNGSVSCIRFRNAFNAEEAAQSYYAVGEYIEATQDLFNYIFIYGIEAHPTDGNCPSNCPNVILTDTIVTQAPDYGYRRESLHSWTSAPEFNFPYDLYADNPDNAVYNTFFERPFGLLGIECDGTVAFRGNWVLEFLLAHSDEIEAWQSDYSSCTISWPNQEDEDNNSENEGGGIGDDNEDDTEGNGENSEEENNDDDGNSNGDAEEDDEDGDNDSTDEDDSDDSDENDDESDNDDGDDNGPHDSVDHALENELEGGTTTLIFDDTKQIVSVYPNPANDHLTIESAERIEYFECLSLSGQRIQLTHFETRPNLWRLDVRNVKSGLYILRINEKFIRVEVRH